MTKTIFICELFCERDLSTEKKGNNCSKFRRLIKEHEGPHGPECKMDQLMRDDGENEEEAATTKKETRKEAENRKQMEERLVKENDTGMKLQRVTRIETNRDGKEKGN